MTPSIPSVPAPSADPAGCSGAVPPRVRCATARDLPAVVALYALPGDGNQADAELDPRYEAALQAIGQDPDNGLFVAEVEGAVVGTFQRTIIQHVAYRGGKVAQIENVMVDPAARGRGVGLAMMRWAIDEARARGCYRVQLTSNKARTRAHRFYERLGFVRSHEGFKLAL
jgi:ribosomal protein S18 acetylase RimI-like enzyme